MKRHLRLRIATRLAACVLALVPAVADAAVPTRLTQQGRLLDAEGVPVEGEVKLLFSA